MPEFYKIKEVAATLKVHPQTVYNWRREGKIKFTRICGRNRIKREELDRFISAQEQGAGEAK